MGIYSFGNDDGDYRVSFRKLGSTSSGAVAYRRGRPQKSKHNPFRPRPVIATYFGNYDYPYHGWLVNP